MEEKRNVLMATPADVKGDIFQALVQYKNEVDTLIQTAIPSLGEKSALRDACEYALKNGGKRFRPSLVLMISRALGFGVDVSQAALAVEYFHTASLVADDLPCMDDDDERRNQPATHKVYGEAAALLVSYALIAAGYESLAKGAKVVEAGAFPFSGRSDRICVLALENATFNTGLHGATGGQFLDIYPPDMTLEVLRDIIHKKTVSLFEVSFVFGWLFGGGDPEKLTLVKKAASHFGMAFQITDDLGDIEQDAANGRQVNMAAVFGKKEALKMFHEEISLFLETLKKLDLKIKELEEMALLLTEATQRL